MGGAPPEPKLLLSSEKSETSTVQSPLKSALLSKPASPHDLPNVALNMVKSVMSTTLSLLASPTLIIPISCWVMPPPVQLSEPELARCCSPFTHQLYVPAGIVPRVGVKNPEASVVMFG